MKKITYIYIFILLIFSGKTFAQDSLARDTSWKTGGVFNLNFNQTSLTNWAAGGENSIAANSLLNIFAKYKKNRCAWDNSLDLAYGLLKAGEKDIRKSEDKIDLLSKFGYDANNKNKWFYTALFNFKSQFTTGYEYPTDTTKMLVSEFASPAYFLFALGMDYKLKDYFSLFISPLTLKATIVNNEDLADAGAFGVDKAEYDPAGIRIKAGENLRTEYGAYLNAKFQKDVLTNVNLLTKLDLFSNYSEDPQHIDVNWEVLIAMKINKYLSASINTQLIYDHDVTIQEYDVVNGFKIPKINPDGTPVAGPRVQFKEVIGVGLSMKF
jgi:hypothetical protein